MITFRIRRTWPHFRPDYPSKRRRGQEGQRYIDTCTELNIEIVVGTSKDHGRHILKVESWNMCGNDEFPLMDFGALPKVISRAI